MESTRFSVDFNGRLLTLETGKLAKQAGGAVLATYGDTQILCSATISPSIRPGIDFFPLMVDYEEKFYATGKIKGSRFIKREGRPSDNAILVSRLIDRPLRPLFPKGFLNEVQIICTVLSADMDTEPGTTAIIGASAALHLAGAPFEGPVGAVRIGSVNGQLIVNPTYKQVEEGDLDLVVAGTKDAIMMVEAGAKEVSEDIIVNALELAQIEITKTVELQEQLIAAMKPKMFEFQQVVAGNETLKVDDATFRLTDLKTQIADLVTETMLDEVIYHPSKVETGEALTKLQNLVLEKFAPIAEFPRSSVLAVLDSMVKKHVRKSILEKGKRPDGRGLKDIRPIAIETGLLKRTHGSALFQRGETQALTITTLGSKRDGQILDEMDNDEIKYYIHHYNFPPFSVGEVKPLRGAGRREIGHGHLAERSLYPVLPSIEEFPYTIRVVSEILESNGSSSMASTCGSTLSLMDAGIPLKRPVSGIAMGLMTDPESGRYAILSDIKDIEDFGGDMDFKVAGTSVGITGLQMDIKLRGLPISILREALEQAKEGRAFILAKMLEAIPAPRTEMSPYAPRVTTIKIMPDQIRDIIGPGGKMINKITSETGVELDVEEDGTVHITSPDAASIEKAKTWIEQITYQFRVGDEFTGKVAKIMTDRMSGKEIGAIVEYAPGKDGMVHISEIDNRRVERIEEVIKVGDLVRVKVIAVDREKGRVSLSRKALLEDTRLGGAITRDDVLPA